MRLPKLTSVPGRSRQQVLKFGGISFSEAAAAGELSFTENICSDIYPCLSPRLGRSVKQTISSPGGIYAGDDLFYIDGDVVYRNGERFGALPSQSSAATASPEGKLRKLLLINSKLVVFPDKVYFNLEDKLNFALTTVEPSDWEQNYTAYFTYDGDAEEYVSVPSGAEAPEWLSEKYYKYRSVHSLDASITIGGGNLEFTENSIILQEGSVYELHATDTFMANTGSYRTYNNGAATFSGLSDTVAFDSSGAIDKDRHSAEVGDIIRVLRSSSGHYMPGTPDGILGYSYVNGLGLVTKIIADPSLLRLEARLYEARAREAYDLTEGFADMFRPGETVRISGCDRSPENNMTLVIRDVIGNVLVFDDNVFTATELEPGTVTIEREVPDFDVVCECNNRIWGAGEDKIYASALGDPTAFNTFDGVASDSYTVAVASAGRFTGCIGYSGNVLFFKEDMMYKVMGDYPANFAMSPYNVAGVAEGSSESLVNLGERLFYHSRDGVYVYTGSLPQLISYNFGTRRFKNAVAAGFGTKYYISMRERENPSAADAGSLSSGQGRHNLYVYDTLRDIWLREDDTEVLGFAEYGEEYLMLTSDGTLMQLESGYDNTVAWSAEVCELTEYINERKCYSKLLLRLDMDAGSSAAVEIRCDRGDWETVWERSPDESGALPSQPASADSSPGEGAFGEFRNFYTANIPIRPTRCDRFSIRLSGAGKVVIRSLIREYETGSDV